MLQQRRLAFYKFVELKWSSVYEIPQSGHCLLFVFFFTGNNGEWEAS